MAGSQGKRWVFTLNNPSDQEIDVLFQLSTKVQYLVFGREVASTGTHHLQGFVVFLKNTRFNAVKLAISSRCWCEVAGGTCEQAAQYCKKDNNFEEFGSLPAKPGRPTSASTFRDWILAQPSKPNKHLVASLYPHYSLQYGGRVDSFIDALYPDVIEVPGEFRPHQLTLAGLLDAPANDRTVYFVVDRIGNTGKSWFARKYFSLNQDTVQLFRVGKGSDIFHTVKTTTRVFIFDVCRASTSFL